MSTKITRRMMLASGAATAAALTATPALAAMPLASEPQSRCKTLHPLIGQNLAMYCDDSSVSAEAKNNALKSAHCPDCAVQITPFGASVGHVRL